MGININKLGRAIKKGFGQGISGINKAGSQVIKTIGRQTGKWDRATGGILGDIVEELPGGRQLMKAYDVSKKGLKTSQGLEKALKGDKSFKSVLRESDLLPDKFKTEALMAYEQSAKEMGRQKNINRDSIKNMAFDRAKVYADRFKNTEGTTKDRLNMIKPAVQTDINQAMQNLRIRNPILSGRLNQLRSMA